MTTTADPRHARPPYRRWGRRAPTAAGSWPASAAAAAAPASLGPGGPAEAGAAPPGGGASHGPAGLALGEPSAAGVLADSEEARFDWQVFLSRNHDYLPTGPGGSPGLPACSE